MKKSKFLAAMLSAACVFATMALPAAATEANYEGENWQHAQITIDWENGKEVILPASDEEVYQVTIEEYENEPVADLADGEEETEALAYPSTSPTCAIYSIKAYPIVRREETGERIYNESFKASGLWSNLFYQSATLYVSPAEVDRLKSEVLTYFQQKNDGYTYSLDGWMSSSVFKFTSNGTIKYEPNTIHWDCYQDTKEISKFVTARSSLKIDYSFAVDPTSTNYSFFGVSGGFYPTNGTTSLMIGGGVGLNSER